ncbi:MAG: NAD(P)-dependent oxidoreductase [Planctomycetaceae bacterium]
MKILIADKLSRDAVEAFEALNLDVDFRPDCTAEDLPNVVAGFNVLVVRSTKITQATIEAADQLSLIVRAGAGVNTIDVVAASAQGIYVSNCPGMNSDAVAELTLGLLIACDRRIPDATAALRNGQWLKKEFGKAPGLKGRTLGILGMGSIGRIVARRARALEMNVLAWSRSLTPEKAQQWDVTFAQSPLDVARQSDAVTLHLAAGNDNRHMVDAEFLEAMSDGAILVNTSRGTLVDSEALKSAITRKGLRVGLDVFENEPGSAHATFEDTQLAGIVCCTPHIGASTDQASEAIAAEVVRVVSRYRESGRPPHAVNLCQRTPATHSLVVRHFNRVGVLAQVLNLLREEGINVEEMVNTIFDGASAACCTLQLDEAPSEVLLTKLASQEAVLQIQIEDR